jgi:glucose-1-phosphate cytidylyltransferase
MEAVILAGGMGTRMGSLTEKIPKPMVELCGKPIIIHLIDYLRKHGIDTFILCCGYKIDSFFAFLDEIGLLVEVADGYREVKYNDCTVIIADTGLMSGTAARIEKIKHLIKNERFILTYGDGLADVDINQLMNTHLTSGLCATITAVHPKERFGVLSFDEDNRVVEFQEKKQISNRWINGGFILFEKRFFDYLYQDDDSLEYDCLPRLVQNMEIGVYCHTGFWQCMDNIEEKKMLEELIMNGVAPWMGYE